MSEKQFVCIDVGYGDDWYITDNGKRLSEIEIVDLLNEQQATISKLEEENKKLRKELNDCEKFRYTVFKRIGDVLDAIYEHFPEKDESEDDEDIIKATCRKFDAQVIAKQYEEIFASF